MRAYRLSTPGSIDGLVEAELPMPKPGHRQVLVKVAACSLNYRDLAIALGKYRMPVKPDLIPLSDGAGEVVEVGPGVARVKVGDRVAGNFGQRWHGGRSPAENADATLGGAIDGMLAEYVLLEEDGTVKLPDHLSFEEGATLPCAAVTAWNALVEHGEIRAGDTVLVQGTGGVSIFALQIARMFGARVIATSSSDEKLARAKALGAADGINYKLRPDWDQAALELTGGRGVDHVVEVGGAGTITRSLGAVAPGGRVSMIGVLTAPTNDFNPMMIMAKRASLRGIFVGSTQMFEGLGRALAANGVKPVIDRSFGWGEVRDAYRHMQSAAHFGKIVITVGR